MSTTLAPVFSYIWTQKRYHGTWTLTFKLAIRAQLFISRSCRHREAIYTQCLQVHLESRPTIASSSSHQKAGSSVLPIWKKLCHFDDFQIHNFSSIPKLQSLLTRRTLHPAGSIACPNIPCHTKYRYGPSPSLPTGFRSSYGHGKSMNRMKRRMYSVYIPGINKHIELDSWIITSSIYPAWHAY